MIAHERLPDGKYNLLLQGASRADLVGEESREGEWGAYRVGVLNAVADAPMEAAREKLQRQVFKQLFEQTALRDLTVTPALAELFDEPASPDAAAPAAARLIDALAFSLVQDVDAKQRMLEEDDVSRRGEMLMRELVALAERLGPPAEKRPWPPEMGVN